MPGQEDLIMKKTNTNLIILFALLFLALFLIPNKCFIVDNTNSRIVNVISKAEFETYKAIEVSAYNTTESQTDDRPCESASGIDLCLNDFDEFDWFEPFDHLPKDGWRSHSMGAIACPEYYPFYTEEKILFQFEFDDQGDYYICLDRMAKKYRDDEYYDILFNTRESALEFGRKYNQRVHVYRIE